METSQWRTKTFSGGDEDQSRSLELETDTGPQPGSAQTSLFVVQDLELQDEVIRRSGDFLDQKNKVLVKCVSVSVLWLKEESKHRWSLEDEEKQAQP